MFSSVIQIPKSTNLTRSQVVGDFGIITRVKSIHPIQPRFNMSGSLPADPMSLCQSCGACCATSKEWPRFSLETDAELERIPEALVKDNLSGMRCEGERCMALKGKIGEWTACTIYDVRPRVCRACQPGDEACSIARATHEMLPVAPQY